MGRIPVLISGLGKMGEEVAKQVAAAPDLELVRFALCGDTADHPETCEVSGVPIKLIRPDQRDAMIPQIVEEYPELIVVDFSRSTAVWGNVTLYCKYGWPFLMGTTGYTSPEELRQLVIESGNLAVIAPNFAPSIVAFMKMLEQCGADNDNPYAGFTGEMHESHQPDKKDAPSGTALAILDRLVEIGVSITKDNITAHRDPDYQRDVLGMSEDEIAGHAWHMITLTSADGKAKFEWNIKINGRSIYALGALEKAFPYLQTQIKAGKTGEVYSMIDVMAAPSQP